MRFSQDCLSATLYAVTSLLISQSDDMGDKLIGASALMGPAWVGAVTAGIAVKLFGLMRAAPHLLLQVNHSAFGKTYSNNAALPLLISCSCRCT